MNKELLTKIANKSHNYWELYTEVKNSVSVEDFNSSMNFARELFLNRLEETTKK